LLDYECMILDGWKWQIVRVIFKWEQYYLPNSLYYNSSTSITPSDYVFTCTSKTKIIKLQNIKISKYYKQRKTGKNTKTNNSFVAAVSVLVSFFQWRRLACLISGLWYLVWLFVCWCLVKGRWNWSVWFLIWFGSTGPDDEGKVR
jgi:hypothetical protein